MNDTERYQVGVAAVEEIRRLCRGRGEPDAIIRRIEQVTGWALERIGDAGVAATVAAEQQADAEQQAAELEEMAGPPEAPRPITLSVRARCRNRR